MAQYNKTMNIKGLEVIIRNPEETDAQQMVNLIKLVDTESTFLAREQGEFTTSVEKEKELIRFWKETEFKLFLVAEVNEKIVATCEIAINSRKRYKHKGGLAIAIIKEYWGRGIGRSLIESCISWCKDASLEKIELTVDSDNERAFSLYEKLGFIVEGKIIKTRKLPNGIYKDSYQMALFL